ncbi:hypothetical protein IscW_ISCW003906 [Ixodes scapularis]|uniref:Uncharacterized protein n=1 Tax=Ixodes scapularis TaxID=6945 RepID=B7PGY0_IXOSC|nr:hypothetical protein IscW_ISCW003906 [Ixodes scapularis]|eukprot:XP_002401588.1 hypothetical protein IscW_ISCW003906 [Ixodes scapularis]
MEALLLSDDLLKFHPDAMTYVPAQEEIDDTKSRILKTPVVTKDLVYGRGDCGAVEEEEYDDFPDDVAGESSDGRRPGEYCDPFLLMFDEELTTLEQN